MANDEKSVDDDEPIILCPLEGQSFQWSAKQTCDAVGHLFERTTEKGKKFHFFKFCLKIYIILNLAVDPVRSRRHAEFDGKRLKIKYRFSVVQSSLKLVE